MARSRKQQPPAEAAPATEASDGAVSALPDGIDRPVDTGGGAVSAAPDMPHTGKLDS